MARICHVTTNHRMPDTRISKQCISLAQAGHRVTVLACSGADFNREHYETILLGEHRPSRLARLVQQLSVRKRLLELDPEIITFHDPELLPLMMAVARQRGRRRPVVYDMHENYEASLASSRKAPLRWGARVYRRILAAAEKRVTLTLAEDSYETLCRREHPVIHNYSRDHKPVPRQQRKRRLIYVGDVAEVRGAITMVQGFAAARLPDWELALIGACNESGTARRILAEASALGVGASVKMLGFLPLDQAIDIVRESSIGLALLHPHPNYVLCPPGKVFEYVSVEIPILLSDFPKYRECFRVFPSVRYVDPQDAQAIGTAMRATAGALDTLEASCQAARDVFLSQYCWDREGEKLNRLYEAWLAER